MNCPRCDADVGQGDRFCIACGLELRRLEPAAPGAAPGLPDPPAAGAAAPPPVPPRLVPCPSCAATNAASRRFCGRCGAWLRPDEQPPRPLPGPAADPAAAGAPAPPARARDSAVPATLVIVTVLTALVVVGVLLTILSARGIGLFAGPPEPPGPPPLEAVEVSQVRASSEVPPSGEVDYGPGNLVDGDETTSWKEGAAGFGEGEWVELRLAEAAAVHRLLVHNGDQRPGRFAEYNRVARVRVEVGERTFTADLLDIEGPQAVDLPEPVTAERVRLVIVDVHPGSRYGDTTLSQIEVHTAPAAD